MSNRYGINLNLSNDECERIAKAVGEAPTSLSAYDQMVKDFPIGCVVEVTKDAPYYRGQRGIVTGHEDGPACGGTIRCF